MMQGLGNGCNRNVARDEETADETMVTTTMRRIGVMITRL